MKELDTGSTHARPPLRGGGGYRRRPAGEYRRPPLLHLFRERSKRKFENLYLNMETLKQNLNETRFEKIIKNMSKIVRKSLKIKVWRGSGGGLGALGGELGTKNLPTAVLADFGQFWPGSDRPKSRPNGPRWRQVGAKVAPRWAKLEPRWPS